LVGSFFKDIRDEKSFLGLDIKKRTDIGFGGACVLLSHIWSKRKQKKEQKKIFFSQQKGYFETPDLRGGILLH
jgi:hypothetical protein